MRILSMGPALFFASLFMTVSLPGAPLKTPQVSTNGLIQCGGQTVYIGFNDADGDGSGGTLSPDGRYSFGWTLRPGPGVKPVDWSKWALRNDQFDSLFPYNDLSKGSPPYHQVYCIVDLKTNRVFNLPVDDPLSPEYPHGGVRCAWSDSKTGP